MESQGNDCHCRYEGNGIKAEYVLSTGKRNGAVKPLSNLHKKVQVSKGTTFIEKGTGSRTRDKKGTGRALKREGTGFPVPSRKYAVSRVKLLEVTLQQTLQSLAVAGFVASHFVDGVDDRNLPKPLIARGTGG